MATTTVYSAAGDGIIRNSATGSSGAAWTTLRNAATGTVADATTNPQVAVQCDQNSYADSKQYIDRAFFAFDTSGIPDGATIFSANLGFYVVTKTSTAGGDIALVAGTQASTSTLATSDFGSCGTTEYATRRSFSGLTTSTYNEWALNSTGLAAISKTGFTKLVLRGSFDLDNSVPTSGQRSSIDSARFSEHTGTSSDPYLTVDYAFEQTFTADMVIAPSATFTADMMIVIPGTSTFTADLIVDRRSLAADNFTEASAVDLTSHTPTGPAAAGTWANHPVSGLPGRVDAGDYATANASSGTSVDLLTGLSFVTADYDVEATFTKMTAQYEGGVGGRWNTSATTGYVAALDVANSYGAGANFLVLSKYVAGSLSVIGSYSMGTIPAVARLSLRMVGTTISVYVDGVQRISVTDSSITAAGNPMLRLTGSPTTGFSADDFAVYVAPSTTATFTADMVVQDGRTSTFTADMIVLGSVNSTFTADMVVSANLLDTFTEASTTAITSHTPDNGGTWTQNTSYNSGTTPALSVGTSGRAYLSSGSDALVYHSDTPAANGAVVSNVYIAGTGFAAIGVRTATSGAGSLQAVVDNGGFLGAGVLRLYRYGGAGTASLGTYTQTWTTGQTYEIAIYANGTTVKVFVDGIERISVTETSITSGRAALRLGGTASSSVGVQPTDIAWQSSYAAHATSTFTADLKVSGSNTSTFTASMMVRDPTIVGPFVTAPTVSGSVVAITAETDDSLHPFNGVADFQITPTGARVVSMQHSFIETFNPTYGGSPGDGENSCRILRCPAGSDPTVKANWAVVADLDKTRPNGVAASDTNITLLTSFRGQSNVLLCNYTSVWPVLLGESAMVAWNRYSISTDDGVTWSTPADFSDLVGFPQPGSFVGDGSYYYLCASRPLLTSSGTLLATVYRRTTTTGTDWDYEAIQYRSTDDGYTWTGPTIVFPHVTGYRFDEPYTVQLADGSLLMCSRVTEDTHATPNANTIQTIWASKSYDDGVTWTTPQRILGPGAQTPASAPTKWGLGNRPCMTLLNNGQVLMVMRAMYSTDNVTLARASGDCYAVSSDGITWSEWYDVRTGALYDFSTFQYPGFHGRAQNNAAAGTANNIDLVFSQYDPADVNPYVSSGNYNQTYFRRMTGGTVAWGQTFTADMVISSSVTTTGTRAFTADMVVASLGLGLTFTADMVVSSGVTGLVTNTSTFSAGMKIVSSPDSGFSSGTHFYSVVGQSHFFWAVD